MVYQISQSDIYQKNLDFNPIDPSVMHIDLNSCFASVEQQANPLLRNKPIAIAAYAKPYGCILAPSIEAKEFGVKVGMTVRQGEELCPWLIVKEADPNKYREVRNRFERLFNEYTSHLSPKSIDEFVLYVGDYPAYKNGVINIAKEIKYRIKEEIGDWLRVSIGVSTNQMLAKLAAGLNKPDGLDIIDKDNFLQIFSNIDDIKDLPGINVRNEARLNRVGVFSVMDMYEASVQDLKSAFQSVLSRYWYTRLRGWEIDDIEFARRSYGQSYVLPGGFIEKEWFPILAKLIEKATRRMRKKGFRSKGIHLYLRFEDKSSWHRSYTFKDSLFDPRDIYKRAIYVYQSFAPHGLAVRQIAVSCINLVKDKHQLNILEDYLKKESLVSSLDTLNNKWGEYTITSGRLLGSAGHVRDAIAFGK